MSNGRKDYWEFYKCIRNRVRKYDCWDLIRRIMAVANRVPCPFSDFEVAAVGTPYNLMSWHPWADLLLLKWVLTDSGFYLPHRKLAPDSLIHQLRREMFEFAANTGHLEPDGSCLLYTSPSPRDRTRSRMPSSA